eukprot:5083773-Amphidinium_carterae.1
MSMIRALCPPGSISGRQQQLPASFGAFSLPRARRLTKSKRTQIKSEGGQNFLEPLAFCPLQRRASGESLGTLRKQECEPKAKKQTKRAVKALQKQKGGAIPAL